MGRLFLVTVVAVVAALLAAGMAPSGTAQVPPEQEAPIDLDMPGRIQTFSSRAPLTFAATVTHTGPSSGSPADEGGEGEVVMSITGVPDGWTASAEPTTFPLQPGASREVTITITAAPDSADSADLTVLAQYTSPDPTKTFLPDGEASGGVTVQRDEAFTTDFLETLGTGVWVLIGVALAAVVVSTYLFVDGRRQYIRLRCAVAEANIRPGAVATLPFTVRHRGGGRDRIAVHADMGAKGWKADIPVQDVELEAGGEEELLVSVSAPKNAAKGSRQVIRIIAVAESKPDRSAVLSLAMLVE